MGIKEILEKINRRKQETGVILQLWQGYFFDLEYTPNKRQINIWLDQAKDNIDRVALGIEATAQWYNRFLAKGQTDHETELYGEDMNEDRFMSLVAGHIKNHHVAEEDRRKKAKSEPKGFNDND